MSSEDEVKGKLADIAARYLKRTAGEMDELQALVGQVPAEGKPALRRIEVLTHRIRGSGAVFGFAEISTAAEAIEMLAVDQIRLPRIDVAQVAERLQQLTAELQAAVHRAQSPGA